MISKQYSFFLIYILKDVKKNQIKYPRTKQKYRKKYKLDMIVERIDPRTISEGLHSHMNHILKHCQSIREQAGHDCKTNNLQLLQSRWII